jgi:hypothetical protein
MPTANLPSRLLHEYIPLLARSPPLSEMPLEVIMENNLAERIRERGGEREVEFLFRDAPRLLPVWTQLATVEYGG